MDKREFTIYLRKKLRRFGDNNAEDAVAYYEEIINEKMREGMSEQAAVASLGDPAKIVADTASDMVADNKVKNPSRGAFLLLGTLALSPVLFPVAIAILVVYIVVFALWLGLTIGFAAGAVGSVVGGFVSLSVASGTGSGLITLGISFIVGAALASVSIVIAKWGLAFLNLITVKLVRNIRNKTKKEVK